MKSTERNKITKYFSCHGALHFWLLGGRRLQHILLRRDSTMKKIIALLLAMIMVLALAACAAKTEPAQAETTAETTAPAETT